MKQTLVLLLVAVVCTVWNTRAEEPEVSRKEQLWLQEARAIRLTNTQAAVQYLQEQAGNTENAAVLYSLGVMSYEAGATNQALRYLEQAVAVLPEFDRAVRDLGRIYYTAGMNDRVIALYTESLRKNRADEDQLKILGYALLLEDRMISAENAFRQVLLLRPDDHEAMEGLVQSLLRQEQYAEASQLLSEVVRRQPAQVGLWITRAQADAAAQQLEEAIGVLETARLVAGETPELLLMLADLYVNQGVGAPAVALYEQLLAEGRLDEEHLLNAVEVLSVSHTEQARHLLETVDVAVLDDPLRVRYWQLTGALAEQRQEVAPALAAYQQVLELDPLNGQAMLHMGDVYRMNEQPAEADAMYQRAILQKDVKRDALIRMAMLQVQRNRYAAAERYLQQAQELAYDTMLEDYLRQLRKGLTE